MSMSSLFNVTPLHRLNTSKLDWVINVRLVRMWKIRSSFSPEKIKEIQLILLDSGGKKIQATVPALCVDLFSKVLCEGCLYSMRNYRNGLSYVIDVIGVVTEVHVNPANDTGAVKVTLADKRGMFECFLYGDYGDELKNLLYENGSELAILLLQFVSITSNKGVIFVESVDQVTKVLLNPPILEVEEFKIKMGYVSGSSQVTKNQFYSGSTSCKDLEFNGLYPSKSLYDFIQTFEDGIFVMCVKIVGLFKVDQWFYPVCHCGDFLDYEAGSYYCVSCHHSVFGTTSKCSYICSCRLQIAVQDATSAALLPMSENLLEGIDVINNNGSSFALSNDGEKVLADKSVLMIVKKIRRVDDVTDDVVEVLRVTDGVDLIEKFHLAGNNFTPTKCIFQAASADLPSDLSECAMLSSLPHCDDAGKKVLVEERFQTILKDSAPEYHRKYIQFNVRNDSGFIGRVHTDSSSSNFI
ncbi:replication factor-A carboxy-terminal domain protein [Trifolium pratense]|uniref:Replication factor-A carboxy-terminal domain protein n=1 Tax=Trifolium pratense TaxID=57577 RepID=A0A2K3MWQ8_TRIPR|nr:replication factor-A carboxy-terminal domain protein [Trifolium pratense]